VESDEFRLLVGALAEFLASNQAGYLTG
jgi:hypothetical protein